jgi:Amt family ammonium transporter
VASFVIIKLVKLITPLRVNAETEEQGLDLRTHGERGYNM